ncbi:YkgJ family cysteine cluster protein [Silvibacterium acidisoli]|uniref:YkgJ family cysteine cluster protein n=1 Tax=Acidobacteriaceae bacterium ZG23-2 TaxID=2883246 RepID=UPI00406C37CF
MPPNDQQLVQIIDAATADAARRAGHWLHCHPGCTQCCVGIFSINQLDAERLRNGLEITTQIDPARAARVRKRVAESVARLTPQFPGDAATGILNQEDPSFEDFGNEETCPVLDPQTGMCDLYSWRPVTCRVFGLPLRTEEGIGVCELCFDGANEQEILAAELSTEWSPVEEGLNQAAEQRSGLRGTTTIAFALRNRGE